jgi:excisionase family DNA binding protein
MGGREFQRAQMKHSDPRINEMFDHLRRAVDVLEQMMMRPYSLPASSPPAEHSAPSTPLTDPRRLAHTLKEVCDLSKVSRSMVYLAIRNKELRAVKCGRRTLVLANDVKAWMDAWPPSGISP